VVVLNGKVISKGFHKKPGMPHAEVNALDGLSRKQLSQAVVYVTLEPCCHLNKRTPPCANFLINSGVKSLVVAMRDPNKNVAGMGIRLLRKHGVKVRVGVLSQQARKLNEHYCYVMEHALPFVSLKMGMSLDARIATSTGESQWITGVESRTHVHTLRSRHDAVLTSSVTVLHDDPELNVRMVHGKQPFRVILDRNLRTSPMAKVYRDDRVLVFALRSADASKLKSFTKKGIEVVLFSPRKYTIRNILKELYNRSIFSVMIEAGGTLAALFLKERHVQRVYLFYAPVLVGAEGKPGIGELGIASLAKALRLTDISVQWFGNDFLIEASL
jgi:diaminohydroxyphosphoribosylaminopyrimidine deaminase/5-amino-6-(5-phosphoribosylamino)uracil reductase